MCRATYQYGTTPNLNYAKMTLELVGQNLYSTGWTVIEGLYPVPTVVKDSVMSIVAATPVYLSNGDNVGGVEHIFTVETGNNVVWTVLTPNTLSLTNSSVVPIGIGTGKMSVALNGETYKTVEMNVINAVAPCITQISPVQNEQDVTLTPTFTWESFDNANGYYIYMNTTAIRPDSAVAFVTDTFYTPNTLSYNTTYYWWVLPDFPLYNCGPSYFTTLCPTYETYDTVVIAESDLPYSYADTTFEVGTPAHSVTTLVLQTAGGCDSTVILDLTILPCAAQIYPADQEENVSTSPTLTWHPVSGVTAYYLYVGTSPTRPGGAIAYVTDTTYSMNLLSYNTTYYWWIIPDLPTRPDCASASFTTLCDNYERRDTITIDYSDLPYAYGDTIFEVGTPEYSVTTFRYQKPSGCDSIIILHLTVHSCVTAIYPADNEQYVSITPTLTWDTLTGVTSYLVYINTTNIRPSIPTAQVTGTYYQPDTLQTGTRYYWWVLPDYPTPPECSPFTFTTTCQSYEVHDSVTIIRDDLPFMYADTTFEAGIPDYTETTFTFQTSEGCDSIVILHLTVATCITQTYPLNHATEVSTHTTLTWEAITGANSYYIYFSTSNVRPETPAAQVSEPYYSTEWASNTTFYWWVVADIYPDAHCSSYTFTTSCTPDTTHDYVSILRIELPYSYAGTIFGEETPENSTTIFHFYTLYGCDSTVVLHLTVSGETQIQENATRLFCYPNPTNGILHIESTTTVTEVQLIDIYGQEIIRKRIQTVPTTLDMSRMASGVYMLRMLSNDKIIQTIKVIKQ